MSQRPPGCRRLPCSRRRLRRCRLVRRSAAVLASVLHSSMGPLDWTCSDRPLRAWRHKPHQMRRHRSGTNRCLPPSTPLLPSTGALPTAVDTEASTPACSQIEATGSFLPTSVSHAIPLSTAAAPVSVLTRPTLSAQRLPTSLQRAADYEDRPLGS